LGFEEGVKKMRQITVIGNRVLPEAEALVRAQVSASMRERAEREAQVRALARRPKADEFASMRFAMRAVEQRIVRGLWVLEISRPSDGPAEPKRNGLDYMTETSDVDARYTDAAGGKWEAPQPRPAVPSNREIESAKEAKAWIEWLDEDQARLLTIAAMTKRGGRERRVNWERVTERLFHLRGTKMRTLQDRYDRALRTIVAELTLKRVA
jgi:hypothetical protein